MQDSKLALITPVGGGGHPDNSLPPEVSWPPVVGHPLPPYPDNGLPNGGNVGHPDHPIHIPPAFPNHDLPQLPSIWPGVPIHPIDPGFGRPGGGGPTDPGFGVGGGPVDPGFGRPGGGGGSTLPIPPGSVWPPLPPVIKGPVLALVWIPGLGYRWTILSPANVVSPPIANAPGVEPK